MIENEKTVPTNMSLTESDRELLDTIGKDLGIPYRSGVVRALAKGYQEQVQKIKGLDETLRRLETLTSVMLDVFENADGAEETIALLGHIAEQYRKEFQKGKENEGSIL